MMKKILIGIAVTQILGIPQAWAIPQEVKVTAEAMTACEKIYREKIKADNAAAPEGFQVKREKGFRQKFIAACLSE